MQRIVIEGARRVDGASGRAIAGPLRIAGRRIGVRSRPSAPDAVLDLAGHLLLPGLVNAHEHLHLNVFPPLALAGPYRHADDWIQDMRRRIVEPDVLALRAIPSAQRAWQGGLKNLLAGTTSVMNHDPWLEVFERPDFPVRVLPELGWAHSPSLAGVYGPELERSLAERAPGRPWFAHVAEGIGARARRDFERLVEAGALDARLRMVHGLGLGPAQRRQALDAGAALIWCPASNLELLGRAADPAGFLEARRVALGSDSRLSGSRDLLDELAVAASTGLATPEQLLRMVTIDAAALCGPADAGQLEAGAPADLFALVDRGRPPAEALLASRRADLRLVIRSGLPALADPDLAWLFDALGLPRRALRLDGRPKWIAASLLEPLQGTGIVEPGLELEIGRAEARAS